MTTMKDDLLSVLGVGSLDEIDGELRDQIRALVAMSTGARKAVSSGDFVMKSQKRKTDWVSDLLLNGPDQAGAVTKAGAPGTDESDDSFALRMIAKLDHGQRLSPTQKSDLKAVLLASPEALHLRIYRTKSTDRDLVEAILPGYRKGAFARTQTERVSAAYRVEPLGTGDYFEDMPARMKASAAAKERETERRADLMDQGVVSGIMESSRSKSVRSGN